MKLIDVDPIGEETGPAFVDGPGGHELRMVTRKVYPDGGGRAFRNSRVAAGRSLRETAKILGLDAVDLSAVERGSKRPEDWPAFWRASGVPGPGCRGCPHPPHLGPCTRRIGGTAYACGCTKQTPRQPDPVCDCGAPGWACRCERDEEDVE